jgi:sodium-dependent phosphate cotransporter
VAAVVARSGWLGRHGVTVLTQSSTVTNSVLVPFAGAGILTPAQVYPVTVGANLGTTFTTVFAAFAVVGQDAKIGLQAAFVHYADLRIMPTLVMKRLARTRKVALRSA